MFTFARRYPLPVCFIVALCAVSAVYGYGLTPSGRRRLVAVTATNLVNLRDDPLGTLIASAFVTVEVPWMWAGLAVLGLFPVVHRFGNVRALFLVATAQVIGTLISEGLVAWQIETGRLPGSARLLDDVGPSYVVASALVATFLYGSRAPAGDRPGSVVERLPDPWWRIGAFASLAVLSPHLFEGLDELDVAAIGHLVAMIVGAGLGAILARVPVSATASAAA